MYSIILKTELSKCLFFGKLAKYLRIDGLSRVLNPFSELTSEELFSESVFYIGMIGMLPFAVCT